MIDAKELRIGNLIDSRIGITTLNIHQLEEILNFTDIDLGYKPIPLTEEWLLKFGFEVDENNNVEYYGGCIKYLSLIHI